MTELFDLKFWLTPINNRCSKCYQKYRGIKGRHNKKYCTSCTKRLVK